MSTAATTLAPSGIYELQNDDTTLVQLSAPKPTFTTPADQGIKPTQGDDTTPPNTLKKGKLNAIVAELFANVGFSTSTGRVRVFPNLYNFNLSLIKKEDNSGYSLSIVLEIEFKNPNPGESMIVSLKKMKQLLTEPDSFSAQSDADNSLLVLIETSFQDFINGKDGDDKDGKWINIDTDIRWTAQAEKVAEAVMTQAVGQSAGILKQNGPVETAKLGPVGDKGRIRLTYFVEEVYTMKEMNLDTNNSNDERDLVPLGVYLPYASVTSRKDMDCKVIVSLTCPSKNTKLLCPRANILAYDYMKTNHFNDEVIVLPNSDNFVQCLQLNSEKQAIEQIWNALPPKPTLFLMFLSVLSSTSTSPDKEEEWVQVDEEERNSKSSSSHSSLKLKNGNVSKTVLYLPENKDEKYMQCALPGGQQGWLLRATTETASSKVPENMTRIHTSVTITDISGSTGCTYSGGKETVRSKFNEFAIRRFLRHIETIPLLAKAEILRPNDYLFEVLLPFDGRVQFAKWVPLRVGDWSDAIMVEKILIAVGEKSTAQEKSDAKNVLKASKNLNELEMVEKYLANIRKLKPCGCTDFSVPARELSDSYSSEIVDLALTLINSSDDGDGKSVSKETLLQTTFVNFDTDGGHNTGTCYKALKKMTGDASVVGGMVNGCGAWVDQHCASKVSKILGGPCILNLEFPSNDRLDVNFRRDLDCWIKAIRVNPIAVKCFAGSKTWNARHGSRNENAMDVLAIRTSGEGNDVRKVNFGLPDVSELEFTKSCIQGLNAGDTFTSYLLSRVPPNELVKSMNVLVNDNKSIISSLPEPQRGIFLGNNWLTTLNANSVKVTFDKSTLCSRLKDRIEDDLSFQWNLPTPNGATSYLGRAKTTSRPVVPKENQPKEPELAFGLEELAELDEDKKDEIESAFSSDSDDEEEEISLMMRKRKKGRGARGRAGGPPLMQRMGVARGPPPMPQQRRQKSMAMPSAPPPPSRARSLMAPPPPPSGKMKRALRRSIPKIPKVKLSAATPSQICKFSNWLRISGKKDGRERETLNDICGILQEFINENGAGKSKEKEDPLVSELLGGEEKHANNTPLTRQDYIDKIIAFFKLWWPLIAPKIKQPKNLSTAAAIDGSVKLNEGMALLKSIIELFSKSKEVNDIVYIEKPAMA